MNKNFKLEIDSPIETYSVMEKYILMLKNIDGLSCEIGLRRGGGTKVMLDTFIKNNDARIHICIDPYGNIPYTDIAGTHSTDYTNTMKNETLVELYKYAFENNLYLLFFNMEDIEYYHRFSDGVPIYENTKKKINKYACVHVDGQHENNAVMETALFFNNRMSVNGIMFFDNTDHYDHSSIHNFLLDNRFVFLEDVMHKKIYKKI